MPKRGLRIKSVPMISAAPISVIPSPRQKAVLSCWRRINQVPRATQSGAVLPSRVAFAAVVKDNDDVHNARSHAVNTPAKSGNDIDQDLMEVLLFARGRKKGNNKKM